MVTRSGSNQFHGTAFEYFCNDVLDANDWFSNREHLPKPAERQNDFGGVSGGPFGNPNNSLTSPLFGHSTETLASSLGSGGANGGFSPLQIGGPRSIELALKLQF